MRSYKEGIPDSFSLTEAMTTLEPVEIKVIYSASRRGRRGTYRIGSAASTGVSLTVFVGVMSVAVAGALYYTTWLRADPKLRVKLLMTTPLPGLNLDAAAAALVPPDAGKPASPVRQQPARPAVSAAEVQAQVTEAKLRVSIVVGWAALVTMAAAALALSGGDLVGRGLGWSKRAGLCTVGLVAIAGVGWAIYSIWSSEGRFVPAHLRLGVLAGLILIVVFGLLLGRGGPRLAYLSAVLLFLSSAGSVAALQLAVQHEMIKPDELPMQLLPLSAVVFIAQSLWGWILLPLAARLRGS